MERLTQTRTKRRVTLGKLNHTIGFRPFMSWTFAPLYDRMPLLGPVYFGDPWNA